MSRTTSIGELAALGALQFGDGYRTKRSEHGQPGYRIIRVADVMDNTVSFEGPDFVSADYVRAIGTKLGRPGDILLTTKGTVGRVAVLPETDEQVVYSPQLCYFRVLDSDVIAPRFLRYWFSSQEFWNQAADRMNNTDMAAYINLADIRSLKITLPSIPNQQAIAEVLGALDDKIAANTNLAATASDLSTSMLMPYPARIPLSSVVVHRKKSTNPESLSDRSVAHFSLPAFDSDQRPEVCSAASIKSNKFLLEKPSVLISKLNPRFPRIWDVACLPEVPALASTEFLVLEPKEVSTAVIWALLSQPSFSASLESQVAGTSSSHQRVRPNDLMATLIPDPSSVPAAIKRQITALGSRVATTRLENVRLAVTRDALLPQLMSGKLRIRDAEKLLAQAGV